MMHPRFVMDVIEILWFTCFLELVDDVIRNMQLETKPRGNLRCFGLFYILHALLICFHHEV